MVIMSICGVGGGVGLEQELNLKGGGVELKNPSTQKVKGDLPKKELGGGGEGEKKHVNNP